MQEVTDEFAQLSLAEASWKRAQEFANKHPEACGFIGSCESNLPPVVTKHVCVIPRGKYNLYYVFLLDTSTSTIADYEYLLNAGLKACTKIKVSTPADEQMYKLFLCSVAFAVEPSVL